MTSNEGNIKQNTSKESTPEKSGSNPLASGINITVSIPESVDIKLVNATAFTDFEIWFYISSLLSNVVVGFWICYLQNDVLIVDRILFWNALVWSILLGASLFVAIYKRIQLSKKSIKHAIQQ